MDKYNQKFSLQIGTTDKITENLPPTSAQSFYRENITFPAVILNSKPANKFYHSIYDDIENIQFKYYNTTDDFTVLQSIDHLDSIYPSDSVQMGIRNVSSALAFAVYEMVTGKGFTGDKGGNVVLVRFQMIYFNITSELTN